MAAGPSATALAFQDDALLRADPVTRARVLDQIKAAGGRNLRVNAIWGQLRKGGAYDFGALDQLVNDARARGIRPQLTMLGTPRYMEAQPGVDMGLSYRQANPALAQQFAHDVAQHFAGRVDRYSAWNEPNSKSFLADRSAKRYRQLYQAMRKGVKGVSPQAQVLLGELMPGNSQNTDPNDAAHAANFLRRVFAAGNKPLRSEGLALHAYAFDKNERAAGRSRAPNTYLGINQLEQAQHMLAQAKARGRFQTAAGGQVPLYLTEFGYHTQNVPNEAVRARLFAAGFEAARKAGARQILSYQAMPSRTPDSWDTSTRPLAIRSALQRAQGRRQ